MSFLSRIFGSKATTPVEPPEGDAVRIGEVQAILEELRPAFLADGGDIQLVSVSELGQVTVRLIGACGTCSLSSLTLRGALEPRLKERLNWFQTLEAAI
ncbi:MAG: Fe-S cluster biogenesis protein NfuA [Planctomycetota bacterium]|jgi:Fe-S cluster biogenesis protein NfuA